jgi:lipoprotein NlpI
MQGRDYQQAIRLWSNVLAIESLSQAQRIRALAGRGLCYTYIRNMNAAIADANEAIELKPDSPEILSLRGMIDLETHELSKSLDNFDAAIRIKPDLAEAHAGRGDVQERLGHFDMAIADYDTAIGIKPYVAEFYDHRGHAYLLMGDADRAIEDFNQAIQRDSKEFSAYSLKGVALYATGRYAEAAGNFEKALSLKADQAYVVIWLDLARLRINAADQPEFARNSANLNLSKWPGPILEYYQGKLKLDQLKDDAAHSPASDLSERTCQVEFYSAEHLIATHKVVDGKPMLLRVREDCQTNSVEHSVAQIKLNG